MQLNRLEVSRKNVSEYKLLVVQFMSAHCFQRKSQCMTINVHTCLLWKYFEMAVCIYERRPVSHGRRDLSRTWRGIRCLAIRLRGDARRQWWTVRRDFRLSSKKWLCSSYGFCTLVRIWLTNCAQKVCRWRHVAS